MKMSIKEAIGMQGTEFDFVFPDGDVIRAYIKKFDPNKALSCWTFSLITDQGYVFKPTNKDEEVEGASCVIGYDLEESPDLLDKCLEHLEEIKLTGKMVTRITGFGVFTGCPL